MKNDFQDQQSEEVVNIGSVIRKHLVPFWQIYIACALAGLLIAFVFLRYINPVYSIKGKVLVKDEKKGIADQAANGLEDLDLFGIKKVVENELEIIVSRPIVKDAVIRSNAQIKFHKIGRVRDVYMGADFPFKLIPLNPETAGWQKKKKLKFDLKNQLFFLNAEKYKLQDFNQILADEDSFLVRCDVKKLASFVNESYYVESIDLNTEITNCIENIEVNTSSKQTSIMVLSLKSGEPTQGVLLLNSIIDAYNKAAIVDKQMIANYTINFIDDRLTLITSQLDSVEQNFEKYKSENDIIDLSEQSKVFLNSVSKQDEDLNEIGVQLSVLDEIENYMNGKGSNPGAAASLMGIDDPMLMELLSKLYNYELLYQKIITTSTPNDDAVISIQEQISKIKNQIRETKGGMRQNLLSAQSKINRDLDKKKDLLKMVPYKERALVNISRQQAIISSIYSFLLEKREASAISYASTVSDGRIIEPAFAGSKPISPNKLLVLTIGLLLGLFIPFLFIQLRESLNTRIQFRSDIESKTKLPILGEIFFDTHKTDFLVTENSKSFIAESFRSIRTKLYYYLNEKDKKVLLVASSIPGEGKSFFTINLGMSYALTKKKTILIAADLRKAMLSDKFNLKVESGLSNYLVDKANEKEIIYPTGFEHLDIIPVGIIPPNPSELLSNGKIKDLIHYLKQHYDVILIDTPPISLFADAELISPHIDATVFIVRHNYTPKDTLFRFIQEIENFEVWKSSTIVFNGLESRGFRYGYNYRYGYGYGNGSGYGYGYGDSSRKKRRSFWKKILFRA